VTIMEAISDVAMRRAWKLDTGDTGRQVILVSIALFANEDGTGRYDMPDDLLADKCNMPVQRLKRNLRWLLENGYLRKRSPGSLVYDVPLSESVRQEWREAAAGLSELPARYRPNGPNSSWVGGHPSMPDWAATPTPRPGDYVVYFLFDHAGDILPVPGQRKAFALEARYIREHRPYLNVAGVEPMGEAHE
jgi:hypothetical protein